MSQERVGALAYRILDTGAAGGSIVSPLGLQKGGKIVAESENIHSIILDANSTKESFVAQFLNRVHLADTYDLSKTTHEISMFYTDKAGNQYTPEEFAKLREREGRDVQVYR